MSCMTELVCARARVRARGATDTSRSSAFTGGAHGCGALFLDVIRSNGLKIDQIFCDRLFMIYGADTTVTCTLVYVRSRIEARTKGT